jgi:N-methylhydantoinase A
LTGFALLLETGVDVEAIEYVAHASTVASNLVIERNAGRTALITSQGFRDVLHIQRQKRADLYDLFYDKPTPVVARRDIFEVRERTLFDGTILVPLDEDDVRDCLRTIAAAGIESVAVVLLHSYANPAPEQRISHVRKPKGCTSHSPARFHRNGASTSEPARRASTRTSRHRSSGTSSACPASYAIEE